MSGNIACSVVANGDLYFFVSTVNLPLRRHVSSLTRWRDDWWKPPYPMETMVWASDNKGNKAGEILHCQGFLKSKSALDSHRKLCRKIERCGDDVLNHREFQTAKLSGTPIGLFKEMREVNSGEQTQ